MTKALTEIGPEKFRAIVSDNTGNTRLARSRITSRFEWMLNLVDAPHHIQLFMKDIGKLSYFQTTIECVRSTVKFFRKSSYANARLKAKRQEMKIKRGLTSFGNTRFSTVYTSGNSLRSCMPAIKALCNSKVVKLKAFNDNFIDGFASTKFSTQLDELLAILGPAAKATKCLESTHSTVSDVYVFWLAMLATIHDVITDPNIPMPDHVREDIRRITNFRWKQMMEPEREKEKKGQASKEVYLTGFVLDPRKS
ncbi:ribonuclease H-like domain-containing protein [Irpex rosettiformis]|uniref:Ribonuclease H-like domain-containing protein n=1 Tax=Irpex rosettiformis TaxID=378272 RepID=A0ACB8TZV1_9APHY|nr:ribonuclease H-like domain-containing protein [Irpex rosettiformis]